MRRRHFALLGLPPLLAGCAVGERALYGSYVAYDMGMDAFQPPVTLVLDRSHRFRFCAGERCARGRWFVRHYGSAGDRLVLVGPEPEAWIRAFLRGSYGPDAFPDPWPAQGEIESDFSAGPIGAEITLGAGDAAFVKR